MNKNFKVDFLCVGFNKCGTTTLETLMKLNSDITLPKNKKETLFFDWYKNIENPLKVLQEKYYPDYLNSKCIGSIEPSYISKAKEVYEYFGKDVNLIFMLRNPIKATNSMFRMRLRRVPNKYYVNLYKKYNNLDDMFNDFIENQIKTKKCKDFFYDDIINEYLKYFKKEQMKFIVMEDFFKNPNKYMKEISKFLNIKNIKYTDKDIHVSNKGDKISKNYLCAYINNKTMNYQRRQRCKKGNNENNYARNIINKIYKYTLKSCDYKMNDTHEKILNEVYKKSITNTSKLIGIDLSNSWNLK